MRYNSLRSDFSAIKLGGKFGDSRENLKFNSFQRTYLEKVYVPCSTKYNVIVEIGTNAPKAHMGLK